MPRAVIITSWIEYDPDLSSLLREDDYIVCLDRGYEIAASLGITPDLILGDFDSAQAAPPEDIGVPVLRYPPEKDYTDLELALRVLDPKDWPDLLIIGGLGGRLDHTVANIQMLAGYTAASGSAPAESAPRPEENEDPEHCFRRILIRDGRNLCFAVRAGGADGSAPGSEAEPAAGPSSGLEADPAPGPVHVSIDPALMGTNGKDCYFSLFPLSGECGGLTLRGAKYTLEEAVINIGSSLCTSNEFTEGPAELFLRYGTLLVVLTLKETALTSKGV